MKRLGYSIFVSVCCLVFCPQVFAASWSYSFFSGTQYPLKVYYIEGESPGPTVMVQGGIQGDETSGFVTAQLLSQSKVICGNLIVLPRANVPSINLHKRQINVDMNRRFDQNYNRFYEDRVARVIRFFLAQSDAFIHLHEGSGFYNPTYVNTLRNPKRYGQSIIIDTLTYEKIDLGQTVNSVLTELNGQIKSKKYQFKLFNTKTFDKGTSYPEMRKSLTCFALAEHGIPAMAVEVSKDIRQLGWKVRQQLTATLMLLKRLGVSVVPPSVSDKDIRFYAGKKVEVRVNGRNIQSGTVLKLTPGTTLNVESVFCGDEEFAPELALFASDRPGVNLMQAKRMALKPFSDLELRSDGKRVAKAHVRWTGKMPALVGDSAQIFVCWLNGQPVFVRNGDVLRTVQGDQLILEGLWGSNRKEVLNLKGFVAIPWANNGQDSGWEIILDPENFIARYSLKSDQPGAVRYQVVRETPGMHEASFFIDIAPRTVLALRLGDKQGRSLLIPWVSGGTYRLPAGEYVLEAAWSNGAGNKLVATTGTSPVDIGASFMVDVTRSIPLTLRQATTFGDLGTMTFAAGGLTQIGLAETN